MHGFACDTLSAQKVRPRGVRKPLRAHPAHCALFTTNRDVEDEVDFFHD
jgi:hypothetical protein